MKRKGLAPLEMVLALPMLVLLAMLIYVISKVGVAKAQANAQARREAWVRPLRNTVLEQGKLPQSPGAFTVMVEKQELRGLASKTELRPTPLTPFSQTISVQGKVVVLLDPLDYVSAPYGKRSRIVPDQRVFRVLTGFANDAQGLMNGVSALSGANNLLDEHQSKAMNELPNVRKNLDELDRHSDSIRDERDKLNREIADLQRSDDPDKEEKIKEKQQRIMDIDDSLEKAKKAREDANRLP